MNIREVVDALSAKADELPAGWETEVRASMCDGSGVEITTAIEVDHMAEMPLDGGPVAAVFAIVQGHPHRDERVQRVRGIAEGADDAVQRWADEDGA